MNAGYIPLGQWVHTEEGGGRIIGEACNIIDLFSFLTESPVQAYSVARLRPKTGSVSCSDNRTIVLEYEDGSVATVEYFAVRSKEFAKERLEVHFDEKTIVVDDYKSIRGYGIQVADIKTSVSEKGLLEELKELAKYLRGKKGRWSIELAPQFETTEVTLRIGQESCVGRNSRRILGFP